MKNRTSNAKGLIRLVHLSQMSAENSESLGFTDPQKKSTLQFYVHTKGKIWLVQLGKAKQMEIKETR